MHTYVLPLSEHPHWAGRVTRFRIDPVALPGKRGYDQEHSFLDAWGIERTILGDKKRGASSVDDAPPMLCVSQSSLHDFVRIDLVDI
jgi:hypothetical protein